MINQATMDFALRHRCESPVKLALGARPAPGVDLAAALRQVAGWQAARRSQNWQRRTRRKTVTT